MFLVGVEAQLRIGTKEPPEPRLFQSRYNVKATESDTRSLGYETMTTSSDPVNLAHIKSKYLRDEMILVQKL